jgi:hypothetical protein
LFRVSLDASATLSQQISDLRAKVATDELRREVANLQGELERTQKSLIVPKAVLNGGVWESNLHSDLREATVTVVGDAPIPVKVSLANNSPVSALKIKWWIRICQGCRFHNEPTPLQHIGGAPEEERFGNFDALYTGSSLQPIEMEVDVPKQFAGLVIGMKYGCETCVPINDWTSVMVHIVRKAP